MEGVRDPTEQAVIDFALAQGFLTSAQVGAAIQSRGSEGANPDLMVHLVPFLQPDHLPLMSQALQRARASASGREATVLMTQAAGSGAPSGPPPQPLAETVAPRAPAGEGGRAAAGMTFGGGRYRVVRELARGGMGVVFVARDTELDRDVALKQMLGGSTSAAEVDRFRREAKAAARLQHHNIVAVFDVGQEQGDWYMVMDLIRGETLQDRLAREGPLPPREVAAIGVELARALEYAHAQKIFHRDIKPHNVLVDDKGVPKLTDFGLAKVASLRDQADAPSDPARSAALTVSLQAGSSLTVAGDLLGTPSYMPPEQANGEAHRVDARADIYSLGATLYALITGRPPFEDVQLLRLLARLFEEPPPPPSALVEVDPVLERILLTCLAKAPEDRFPSAAALADALESYLAAGAADAESAVDRGLLVVGGLVGVLALLLVAGVLLLRSDKTPPGPAATELAGATPSGPPESASSSPTPGPEPTPSTEPSPAPTKPSPEPPPSPTPPTSARPTPTPAVAATTPPPATPPPVPPPPTPEDRPEPDGPEPDGPKTDRPQADRPRTDRPKTESKPALRLVRATAAPLRRGRLWPKTLGRDVSLVKFGPDGKKLCFVSPGTSRVVAPVWRLFRGLVPGRNRRPVLAAGARYALVPSARGFGIGRLATVEPLRRFVLKGKRITSAISDRWVAHLEQRGQAFWLRVEDVPGRRAHEVWVPLYDGAKTRTVRLWLGGDALALVGEDLGGTLNAIGYDIFSSKTSVQIKGAGVSLGGIGLTPMALSPTGKLRAVYRSAFGHAVMVHRGKEADPTCQVPGKVEAWSGVFGPDDAWLAWLERDRIRVLRLEDGRLGAVERKPAAWTRLTAWSSKELLVATPDGVVGYRIE